MQNRFDLILAEGALVAVSAEAGGDPLPTAGLDGDSHAVDNLKGVVIEAPQLRIDNLRQGLSVNGYLADLLLRQDALKVQLNAVMLIEVPRIVAGAVKDLVVIGLTANGDEPWIAFGHKGHHAAVGHGDMTVDQFQNGMCHSGVIDTADGVDQVADRIGVYRYACVV
jgi:hypothetical protein